MISALDKVNEIVVQLGTDKKLRRFLQRHEIAGRILTAHQALNTCVELYQVSFAHYDGEFNSDVVL